MNGYLKSFITVSLVAVACSPLVYGSPVAAPRGIWVNRRQDTPTSTTTDFASSATVTDPALPTSTDLASSITATDSVFSTLTDIAPTTIPVSDGSPTITSATASFTPFTGTFAPAPEIVSEIESYESAHPGIHTITFVIDTETSTPSCNVVECPLTTTTAVPIFPSGTGVAVPPPVTTDVTSWASDAPEATGGFMDGLTAYPQPTPTDDITDLPEPHLPEPTETSTDDSTYFPESTTPDGSTYFPEPTAADGSTDLSEPTSTDGSTDVPEPTETATATDDLTDSAPTSTDA